MGVHDLVCSLWPVVSSSRASALAADAVPCAQGFQMTIHPVKTCSGVPHCMLPRAQLM